jgi:hypothetical protein
MLFRPTSQLGLMMLDRHALGRGSRRVKAMLVAIVLETVDCVWSVRCRCQDDGVNGEIDEAIAKGWMKFDEIECVLYFVVFFSRLWHQSQMEYRC